jgi:hypothetical protein
MPTFKLNPRPYEVLITFKNRCYISSSVAAWKLEHGYSEVDGSIKEEREKAEAYAV